MSLHLKRISAFAIPIFATLTLTPWVSSAQALILGVFVALVFGNPYAVKTKEWTHRLLSLAVMGLGAGMNLAVVGRVGVQGIGYTIIGIFSAFVLGTLLGKILKIEENTSLLITVGTAICGGSAIAAVAPVIRAKPQEVSVSLGTVFLLNAAALFIFPWVGHQLMLTENQFGLWSALAIHDTSSVVGATLQYGPEALSIGTTTKLARALWIIPVAMGIGFLRSRRENADETGEPKGKKPWFILGFLIAAALVTWVPDLQPAGHIIEMIAKKIMVLTLFLIGAGLTKATLQSVGFKPFLQGVVLWFFIASGTLTAIYFQIIH